MVAYHAHFSLISDVAPGSHGTESRVIKVVENAPGFANDLKKTQRTGWFVSVSAKGLLTTASSTHATNWCFPNSARSKLRPTSGCRPGQCLRD